MLNSNQPMVQVTPLRGTLAFLPSEFTTCCQHGQ